MADGRTTDSVLGLFLRLYWMMLGNGVVVIAAVFPLAYQQMPTALPLAGFGCGVVSLIAARFVDIRYCGGQTVDGAPASLDDWKRYVRILVPSALLLLGVVWGARAVLD
jgi:hypothetical protein